MLLKKMPDGRNCTIRYSTIRLFVESIVKPDDKHRPI